MFRQILYLAIAALFYLFSDDLPARADDPAEPVQSEEPAADPNTARHAKLPRPAANISMRIGGNDLTLADFKGGVVLVEFWATWSKPSMKLQSHFESLQKKYAARGFAILGISIDEDPTASVKYLTRNPVAFPVIVDGGSPSAHESFGVASVPAVFLVDREGMIVAQWFGDKIHEPDIAKAVEQLMSAPPPNQ